MAEKLLNKAASERGLYWEARSCGLAAEHYFRVPPPTLAALLQAGIPQVEHKPRLVHRELLQWADLVLAMTRRHRDALTDHFPEHARKVAIFLEHVGLSGDIEDPMGGPPEKHFECCKTIARAVEALLDKTQEKPIRPQG